MAKEEADSKPPNSFELDCQLRILVTLARTSFAQFVLIYYRVLFGVSERAWVSLGHGTGKGRAYQRAEDVRVVAG
jgi:hypothetical protein